MCVSLRPARFSKTRGLAAEALRKRKLVHLLGYGNNVANGLGGSSRSSAPTRRRSINERSTSSSYGKQRPTGAQEEPGGNAMLLPIPCVPGTMTDANIVDTSSAPSFMKDLERTILPPATRGGLRRGGKTLGADSFSVQIFDHDVYTIVLASDAKDIAKVLKKVRADRRPEMNQEIFDAYAKWYKGWTFALCCFNVAQESEAKPMLWWYEPSNPDLLFFPAIDAHDGNAPDLDADVDVDHCLIFGSHRAQSGNEVYYTEEDSMDEELRKLLPTRVVGEQYSQRMQQGDFVADLKDIRAGRFDVRRELPPGA